MTTITQSSVLGHAICTYIFKNRSVYFGNKRWSRGVTTVIQKVFCPSFSFKQIKQSTYVPGLPKRRAIRRGHLVDRTLDRWVHNKPLRCRVPEPRLLVQTFLDMGWLSIASQLPVAWSDARLATKIDLVLYEPSTMTILVVEVKTGYGYRRCPTKNGYLRYIHPRVNNSPLHQHQLQALIGKELFSRTYTTCTRDKIESVLIYISSACEIEMIREQDFSVKYTTDIDNILLRTA